MLQMMMLIITTFIKHILYAMSSTKYLKKNLISIFKIKLVTKSKKTKCIKTESLASEVLS